MLEKRELNNVHWVDLESPTKEELNKVMRDYDIDPMTMHELLEPSLKPRAERHDKYLYFVLHFPSTKDNRSLSEFEVDFILGKDFMITTRYKADGTFEAFKRRIELFEKHNDGTVAESLHFNSAPELFLDLLIRMYKSVDEEIEEVHDALEDIEEDIFNEKEKEMVFAISLVGRDILNLRQALDPHQDILKSMSSDLSSLSPDSDKRLHYKAKMAEDIYYRLRKTTHSLSLSLQELRETNNTLLSTKQNEVMKIFTILAFVTFPLSLVSSIFGMNTEYMPVQGRHLDLGFVVIPDFWLVIFMMVLATAGMFMYFKKKKWI